MTDLTTFPIPTKILDPAEYPAFKGETGPATEWGASATHLQARPVGSATWVDIVALSELKGDEGDPGTNGRTILTATGAPDNATGTDGDYALDLGASTMYGPKAAGAWPAGVSIKGAGGATTLAALTDVDTTGATDGQALVYDAATETWEPGSVAASGGGTAPVSTLAIVAGAISTPLDGSAYRLTLSEDVASGWSATLPSGGDASAQTYWASLDILPPASGGPFALSIPAEWQQAGPLDTIALAAGDVPISITLRTWGAADIAYSAGWVGA